MSLYTIQIGITNPDKPSGAPLTRFDLRLSGSGQKADEGDWSTDAYAATYLGQSDGAWKVTTDKDGFKQIWLMEGDDPNMISWLWRDMPQGLCFLEGVLKLPLFLGETGTGGVIPIGRTPYGASWRVIQRSF